MARTREQWNDLVTGYATGWSSSAVAEWKLLRDMAVTIAIFFEGILEFFKADVENTLANKQAGTLPWIASKMKEFQNGDSLTVTQEGIVKYAVTDVSKRIITQVSVSENEIGTVVIKLAKTSGGLKTKLTNEELSAARNYAEAILSPGVERSISSLDANVVTYHLTAYFDPAYDATALNTTLQQTFMNFRDHFDFGGTFVKSQLEKELSSVPGIRDIQLTIDMNLGESVPATKVTLPSGYFNWDAGSTITMNAFL